MKSVRTASSGGVVAPGGSVALRVVPGDGLPPFDPHRNHSPEPSLSSVPARGLRGLSLGDIVHFGMPQRDLPEEVNRWRAANQRNLWRRAKKVLLARRLSIPTVYGALSLAIIRSSGEVVDLGLASCAVVTDTGVGFLVDALENLVEPETMKYHGLGTGGTAEAASQTALVTELTTQYNPDSTRATGSLTETSANVFRTVGTNTVDASAAVTEHAILSQAATGGGVMLDRSLFSVVNLASGDSLQSTYDFTITSGG